jgi:uncharacterized protein (DUF1800 family)
MADRAKVIHLLRRTEFVVRPARLKRLSRPNVTLQQAVDDVLNFSLNPPAVLRLDPDRWESRDEALQWWVARMASVPRPLQEKLTMFWHGHFVSSWEKVPSYQAMIDQNMLFRKYAAGDLRVLTQKMSLQPAMLYYLDNLENSKWSPNQNFARELMELFTLGVTSPDTGKPNYSERDVEAAAAAWTGHGINWETHKYEFHEWDHDTSDKTFFGTRKNWDGPDTIDEILRDNPGKRRIAARFITRKLWEFFAAPLPNGSPNPPYIVELSEVLLRSDMQIRPLLRAMFTHPRFYGKTVRTGLVRTPTDFAVALAHHSKVPTDQWLWSWDMQGTGQVPFWPPNVSGWRHNGYWINTTAFSARAGMARSIAWRLAGWDNDRDRPRPLRTWIDEATPQQAYDRVARMFYRDPDRDISPVTRDAILTWLKREPVNSWHRPEYLIGLMIMAPEFHLA